MAEHKATSANGSDAEVFMSASEDEAVQQEVTPELLSALVKQVEFYFSDANLPTDKKLLKQIRKDPEGFVPVKLFANFRKVRALSKDVAIITEALRNAKLLQLSEDGKRVKRLVTVPDYDIGDIQRRTIVVEDLPAVPSPTIESVTDMFRMYGRVKLVRICSRESKGKLPSWLTSSCQNMQGQHAYVEFEDEEGAVLAAAALAQEYDAPDGAVQVRRLLACIAEHRERRSGAGASSFGGSSVQGGMNGSRKGSRDVSPNRPGAAGSRRNSHGGMSTGGAAMSSYGGAYSSMGGASTSHGWASMGGAAPSDFGHAHLHVPHHHHSYGGAYEHFGGSRRGSGGGAPSCGGAVMPPPPPPPRRSCDSAPASELLHSALVAPPPPPPPAPALAAPLPVPAPTAAPAPAPPPRLNIYRPPAKRLSDGVSGMPASAASPLIRSSGGSFTSVGGSSHCSASSSVVASAVSTPTVASQLASPMVPPVAVSPPLASRPMAVSAGGKPPVPHAALHAPHAPAHAAKPEPAAALPSNALAEAIAAAAAERRASEAGAKASEPVAAAPRAPISVAVPAAPSAPKFVLDLPAAASAAAAAATARRTSPSGTASGEAVVSPSGAPLAPKVLLRSAAPPVAAAAAPAARATQMVADVEGFINNILASSIPAPRAAVNGAGAAMGAKPAPARKQPAPKQLTSSAQPQDAAAAVAGILASALRAKAPAVAPAPAAAAPAGPMIFLTAVMEGEDIAVADLEHAVTVNVHVPVAAAAAPKSAATTPAKGAAAATATALPKYSPPSAALRSSAGGLAAGATSPVLATAASISDGGAAGSGHSTPASAMVHVARGPDGSRGFGRRGSLMA